MKSLVNQIICGDTLTELKKMPDESIDCIITSPPYYGLRDYGVEGQIGLEKTLNEYLEKMLEITVELKRVLKKVGTMFWNHGDCYGGTGTGQKPNHKGKFTSGQFASMTTDKIFEMKNASTIPDKCLSFQNFRFIQMIMDKQNWILRNVIIWHKPNVMPASVKDRFIVDFEPIFFLTKNKKYWFETQYEPHQTKYDYSGYQLNKVKNKNKKKVASLSFKKIRYNPKGRVKRTTWKIPTKKTIREAHFATFPEKLIEPMILAGCPKEGIILDPFMGSGTVGLVAKKLGRNYLGIELNPEYIKIAKQRLRQELLF